MSPNDLVDTIVEELIIGVNCFIIEGVNYEAFFRESSWWAGTKECLLVELELISSTFNELFLILLLLLLLLQLSRLNIF